MPTKYFTKSAFATALECPRRLYYAYDKNEYANQDLQDEFLQSLAEGGFQVGALAKVLYGIDKDTDIDTIGYVEALAQKWDFKVGFEIKTCSKDLIEDDKIPYYLGWTDFFFLGVKDDLIDVALKKAEGDPRLGVVSLTSGEIHKMPAWQDVPMGRKYELMEQAFYQYSNNSLLNSFIIKNKVLCK